MPDFFSEGIVPAAKSGLYTQLRAKDVRISFMVYDILPISDPQFFPAGMGRAHANWLRAIAENADQLICISQDVADRTVAWIRKNLEKSKDTICCSAVHLGADVNAAIPSKGLPTDAPHVLEQLERYPTFLMVGTIEPRKGYLQTLKAFERLWREGAEINLIIVGKDGWKNAEIVQGLGGSPELGKNLFWLEGISDEYLEKIYAASSCLIAASEGEGFGLPLIEAARHKLPILARDIPVFREVAGDHAAYFSGLAPEDLARAVRDWLALYQEDQHVRSDGLPWISWNESVRRLLQLIVKDSGSVDERSTLKIIGATECLLAE